MIIDRAKKAYERVNKKGLLAKEKIDVFCNILINEAMIKAGGSLSKASASIGISRDTCRKWLQCGVAEWRSKNPTVKRNSIIIKTEYANYTIRDLKRGLARESMIKNSGVVSSCTLDLGINKETFVAWLGESSTEWNKRVDNES